MSGWRSPSHGEPAGLVQGEGPLDGSAHLALAVDPGGLGLRDIPRPGHDQRTNRSSARCSSRRRTGLAPRRIPASVKSGSTYGALQTCMLFAFGLPVRGQGGAPDLRLRRARGILKDMFNVLGGVPTGKVCYDTRFLTP